MPLKKKRTLVSISVDLFPALVASISFSEHSSLPFCAFPLRIAQLLLSLIVAACAEYKRYFEIFATRNYFALAHHPSFGRPANRNLSKWAALYSAELRDWFRLMAELRRISTAAILTKRPIAKCGKIRPISTLPSSICTLSASYLYEKINERNLRIRVISFACIDLHPDRI